jgi:hypothetical protein
MQVFCNKWSAVTPQKTSAVSVTTNKIHKNTFVVTKHSCSDFLTYGIALNPFSVADDGCFNIRDSILVLGVM